ncbi:DUF1697 domain-containing protein [Conyzicola nivalis]|uniref:DUF1697 domain-containing protein n=1 Tax=Conyzicola nivalis TaxID=1477021 RepID=A0A916SGU0_9MICO|nr:DUF1697 domain-containing protein [Conyzicola nivalis]GGA99859.1 hypothetical protein GCM10010979_12910 [Conyzicola nivalis]
MNRYVALLRGINVGTAKPIAMADLRACIEALGHSNARTLLRSGNVVFDSAEPVDARSLETAIATATGVSAPVVLVDDARFRQIVAANPLAEVSVDPSRALVYFLSGPVAGGPADDTGRGRPSDTDLLPERLAFGEHAIYQWCPDGISQSKVPAKYFLSLGVTATGRNLRTVEKIVALLDTP